ncbi:MAG: outer membrane lipoprotein chaperone LolA [Pseudomonadales bacterium]|nr:outer membrane lipoprotein chaperone LolA [Pseudomonadales bacterium]MCP5319514.1 outer membrane lipoprotein chaperone LolA [Pseudomonadales bacterium]MCP5338454.1 outer membrane lipoprotein chaperone LolA [Pseudomonadales bacterium]
MSRFAAVAALVLLCSAAFADAGAATRLGALLGGMRRVEADFVQRLFDESGAEIQQSSGHVLIVHPGRFRWETREPFEQLVVSDGATVWQYDPDLAQVIVRPLDRRADQVPSLLLSGDIAAVEAQFEIRNVPSPDGNEDFELDARDSAGMFSRLDVRFAAGVLRRLSIADGLGQRTEMEFSGVVPLGEVAPDTFRFMTPPGVDELHDE